LVLRGEKGIDKSKVFSADEIENLEVTLSGSPNEDGFALLSQIRFTCTAVA